jgi:hypothetical protein
MEQEQMVRFNTKNGNLKNRLIYTFRIYKTKNQMNGEIEFEANLKIFNGKF